VPSSEMLVRRARLTAEITVNDFVTGKIQPDYGEGELSLKDAYVRLDFGRSLRTTFGQFKRPFDLFELTSSTQILVVERAGGVRGVDTCTGPGGVCSFSRFTEGLEYSDRDIGVLVDGRVADGAVGYMASFTNGAGSNSSEENDSKSFGGRVEVMPIADLMLAGNVAVHDYVNPVRADDRHAVALGGDLDWGDYARGLHVQAGAVAGDNWANLDAAGEPSMFVTAQAIVTFRHPISEHPRVEAIEPVGRISWGDPDTDVGSDDGFLLTPGLVVHFVGRNKVAFNVDIWSPSEGDTEWSFKGQTYLHF
ncbi:MAG: porin, partial [Halobacteriales archaeon]|nr:porin [Halobacteriales archaeon]